MKLPTMIGFHNCHFSPVSSRSRLTQSATPTQARNSSQTAAIFIQLR